MYNRDINHIPESTPVYIDRQSVCCEVCGLFVHRLRMVLSGTDGVLGETPHGKLILISYILSRCTQICIDMDISYLSIWRKWK